MIKVLIIDDSALVRQVLTKILDNEPDITVVGTAIDPLIARNKIKKLNPDVLTLDVEMPRMDGITFLSNLMRLHPMPVVMISSLTQQGAEVTLEALHLGAVDFISKPTSQGEGLEDYASEIIEKVRLAAHANVKQRVYASSAAHKVKKKLTADAVLAKKRRREAFKQTESIVALGASTGGTEATLRVLQELPASFPAIVISQHLPASFSASYTRRLNRSCAMEVVLAEDGMDILPGHVYVAPGTHHLIVKYIGGHYRCSLCDGPEVNRHRPSVDVMFRSVAQCAGPNALGLLLTGMGNDGAAGLKEMQEAGAFTIAQNEATSVVWGMPGEAYKCGAVSALLPLHDIAAQLMEAC